MKKWILGIVTIVVLFVVGTMIGYYIYSLQHTQQTPMEEMRLAEQEITQENTVQKESVTVAAVPKTIQPDTSVWIKEYYTKCDHLIQEEQMPKNIVVNMTKEELQAYYEDYTVETFSEEDTVLYKECEEWCPKHYILKEDNGVIVIYRLNAQGKETVVEKTDILTEYLPAQDQERLQEGIIVFGDELLNSTLEDFE